MGFRDVFRRSKPAPREYLYVDQERLNSYLEQISSTSTYDKVPSLGLGLSRSGPSVRAEQARHVRPKFTHEKIEELIAHLNRNGHLRRDRPCWVCSSEDDLTTPPFVLETCDAVPVLIPATDDGQGAPGVMIWVSEWPIDRRENVLHRPGLVCIIQDASRDDRQHRPSFSSYTWLLPLLHQLHLQPSRTALATRYPRWRLGDYTYDIMAVQSQLEPDRAIFRPHPLRWLEAQGCRVGAPRRISALYRIRAVSGDEIGTENREEDFTISTFAYGIAIWAA
jgi:hypothetical protein